MIYGLTFALLLMPALGEPRLLWSGKMAVVLLLTLASVVLQPRFSPRDATGADRGTARAFMMLTAPYLLATVAEARFFRLDEALSWTPSAAFGLALALAGLALRTWSVRTLGKFFTLHVRAMPDQMVVKTGPYRYMRHPAYTGALMMLAGMPVMMAAWATAAAFSGLFFGWIVVRMRQEEAVLEAALGPEYTAYKRATPALVPFT